MERVNKDFKDRTDDYYPCSKKDNECNLDHVFNWENYLCHVQQYDNRK